MILSPRHQPGLEQKEESLQTGFLTLPLTRRLVKTEILCPGHRVSFLGVEDGAPRCKN